MLFSKYLNQGENDPSSFRCLRSYLTPKRFVAGICRVQVISSPQSPA